MYGYGNEGSRVVSDGRFKAEQISDDACSGHRAYCVGYCLTKQTSGGAGLRVPASFALIIDASQISGAALQAAAGNMSVLGVDLDIKGSSQTFPSYW